MTRFWNGLICLLFGCDMPRITKTSVRLGDERLALHVCERCDASRYMTEGEE